MQAALSKIGSSFMSVIGAALIQKVDGIPLCFSCRWWKYIGVSRGRSFTAGYPASELLL